MREIRIVQKFVKLKGNLHCLARKSMKGLLLMKPSDGRHLRGSLKVRRKQQSNSSSYSSVIGQNDVEEMPSLSGFQIRQNLFPEAMAWMCHATWPLEASVHSSSGRQLAVSCTEFQIRTYIVYLGHLSHFPILQKNVCKARDRA